MVSKQIDKTEEEARREAAPNNTIEKLRTEREETRRKFDESKNIGEATWEDLKTGMDNAYEESKLSIHEAIDKLW